MPLKNCIPARKMDAKIYSLIGLDYKQGQLTKLITVFADYVNSIRNESEAFKTIQINAFKETNKQHFFNCFFDERQHQLFDQIINEMTFRYLSTEILAWGESELYHLKNMDRIEKNLSWNKYVKKYNMYVKAYNGRN